MEKSKLLKAGISVAAVAVLAASGYALNAYSKIKSFNNCIYPNVKVQSVDIGGKTKDEAKAILSDKFSNLSSDQKIIVTNEGKEYPLDLSNVKISYNFDEVIETAFNFGKDKSFIDKYRAINNKTGTDINLEYSVEESTIDNYIASIKSDINKEPVDAKINIIGGQPKAVQEVNGKKINDAKLKEQIIELIKDHKETVDKLSVEIESTAPRVTSDKIASVSTLVSSFTTSFGSSSSGRATNISLAAKTISGTLLLPGDTFSFNNIVGDTTADKGYKPAGVIVGDKIEQDYGGGVCQVSTTLYNTIMKMNLKPVERHPHNLPVSYVPIGCDAAISYGSLDFQFKNQFSYPIYIEGYTQGGKLTFNIYSNPAVVDSNKTYKLRNEVYETIAPHISYVDDPSLNVGEEKVIQGSSQGYKAKSYLDVFENGTLVTSEQVGNDTYNAVNGKIARGTKPVSETKAEKETKQ